MPDHNATRYQAAAADATYAELHCLSAFSFQRGASMADELFEQAQRLGYSALAITDECSLAGIVRAHEAAQETGVKLIVGSLLPIEDGPTVLLLVPDLPAYEALSALITHARRRSPKGRYRLLREDFVRIPQTALAIWIPDPRLDASHAAWVRDHFAHRAWIGVHLHRRVDDRQRLERLQELGARFGLPLTACNDVRYHLRERRPLHDVMTAIRHGLPVSECGHRLMPNAEHHLRSLEELRALYPRELLEQTLHIAQRCSFRMTELKYEYPRELVPEGHSLHSWLRELTERGMRTRWPQGANDAVRATVEKELAVIAKLQYEAFFLTVADIVHWAKQRDILCQGRGSAANSVVCYALGITEIDPVSGHLLFERFISEERNEPPDIDVDFEHQRREEVIQYIYGKYERHRAAIAATVIRYRPRSAMRDVGKALGISPDHIDALAKSMAWWDNADQLPQRLLEIGLDPSTPQIRHWILLTNELIGFPRHLSQHVGGFVISDRPVSHLVPIENAAMDQRTIIQWDKDDLETLGLLKVDVLALGMLSALRRSLAMVSQVRGAPFAITDIPREDPATFDMICEARTVGVFQIESRAQMTMLPRLKPRCLYDLVIEVAIVRPGPIQGDMVHPYLRRRQGKDKVVYQSPELEHVLKRTLGVPLFQEQVIQIATVAAGYSGGEADQLRRSMAAWKKKGGLESHRLRLMQGMAERGYSAKFGQEIFEMMKGFGSYGFPESHSASFALLAYASAWLKCHEPAAFFAGLVNSQPMGFYAPAQLIQEARRSGVRVLPVDVNHSGWDCTLDDRSSIRLGLRLVGSMAEDTGRRIEQARAQGAYRDLEDLVHRARLDARDRRVLADADALRGLTGHRHQARWSALGAERLPGMLAGHAAREAPLDLLSAPREADDILDDYASTGLSLRRHPVALLRAKLAAHRVQSAAELEQLEGGRSVRVAGLVINRQRPGTAKGTVFMTLEDETGSHNLIVWGSVLEAQRLAALRATFLIVSGKLQKSEGVTHVVVERFWDRSHWLGGLSSPSRDFH
jgi:error-prone DNA polymerase